MRKHNNPKTKIAITLELETCADCPLVMHARTMGAGYALDYFCTHKKVKNSQDLKKVMSYIEWASEYAPVPEWCPYRKD